MLIKEIKKYLFNKKQAGLDEISFHLNHDKEVILHALHFLIQKGLVKKESLPTACKRCYSGCNCNDKENTMYKLIR